MRYIVLPLLASIAVASPALANEARVEARGGVVWDSNNSEATAGVAVGYDWDLGANTFVGLETSADKILTDNQRVTFGIGGRVGVKTSPDGKLYAVSTYQTKNCKYCEEFVSLGAGYQHTLSNNVYGKVEYRHNFVNNSSDYDAALVGVGMKF